MHHRCLLPCWVCYPTAANCIARRQKLSGSGNRSRHCAVSSLKSRNGFCASASRGLAMRKSVRLKSAFISAALTFCLATAAHAADPSTPQNQSAQFRERNHELTRRLSELEKRLRKLENKGGKHQVTTPKLA